MALSRERWAALVERLGCRDIAGRFDELEAAYSESHRGYHDTRHIGECLELFDRVRGSCERADEVEFAIWMHDSVYQPRRSDNEERSADLAAGWLGSCDSAASMVPRVRRLILATRHDEEPTTSDEALLVDIDLHILGAGPERFDEYEAQVRREYKWVPGPLFRRGRAEILRSFEARDPLYRTAVCRDRFEEQARWNLRRSLEALGG